MHDTKPVTTTNKPVDISTSVENCPRCGCDHSAVDGDPIEWHRMERPASSGNLRYLGAKLTHWGVCPVTGDPILASGGEFWNYAEFR